MAPVLGDPGMEYLRTVACSCRADGQVLFSREQIVRDAACHGPFTGNGRDLRSRPRRSTDMAIFSGPNDVNVNKGAKQFHIDRFEPGM